MDHKTCGGIIVIPDAAGTNRQPQSEELAQQTLHGIVAQLVLSCSRAAAMAIATYIFAATAWRARYEPGNLAFILAAYAFLAALLLCLHRAESLTPDSPPAVRGAGFISRCGRCPPR
jgi:hypothetical protein